MSISCKTDNAEIRYTIDGNDPDESSALYSSPFNAPGGTIIKACGYKEGLTPSAIGTREISMIPTDVPIGTVLYDGSVVIYDQGSQYGSYNLNNGYLMRISEGADDGTVSSQNWRFLIADSQDLEDIAWGPRGILTNVQSMDVGAGLPNTDELIESNSNSSDYIWSRISTKRLLTGEQWFLPSYYELAAILQNKESLPNKGSGTYYWSSSEITADNARSIKTRDLSLANNFKDATNNMLARLIRRY